MCVVCCELLCFVTGSLEGLNLLNTEGRRRDRWTEEGASAARHIVCVCARVQKRWDVVQREREKAAERPRVVEKSAVCASASRESDLHCERSGVACFCVLSEVRGLSK